LRFAIPATSRRSNAMLSQHQRVPVCSGSEVSSEIWNWARGSGGAIGPWKPTGLFYFISWWNHAWNKKK